MAIAVYPPPGPREDKRSRGEYILLALSIVVGLGIIAAAIWLYVSGTTFN